MKNQNQLIMPKTKKKLRRNSKLRSKDIEWNNFIEFCKIQRQREINYYKAEANKIKQFELELELENWLK